LAEEWLILGLTWFRYFWAGRNENRGPLFSWQVLNERPDKFCGTTTSTVTTNSSKLLLETNYTNTGGNIQTPSEAGNTTSKVRLGEGLVLLVPKKDWRQRSVINLKALNSFVLQDGGNPHPQRPAETGRLVNKSRPEGCVLCNPMHFRT